MISKSADDILKEVEEELSSDSSKEDDDKNVKEEEEFNEPFPELDMVTLVSSDGRRFHLQRKVAYMSSLLKGVFEPGQNFKESVENEIQFPNIRGEVLDKVVDYLHYSFKYSNNIRNAPKFEVKDDILLETLVAADYLMI